MLTLLSEFKFMARDHEYQNKLGEIQGLGFRIQGLRFKV